MTSGSRLSVGIGGHVASLTGRKINDRFTNNVSHLVNAIVETVLDKCLVDLSGNGSGNLNARLSHDESLSLGGAGRGVSPARLYYILAVVHQLRKRKTYVLQNNATGHLDRGELT